jgi:hypothetical protein
MRQRQQNSTIYPVTFFLVGLSDHITGLAGATPVVTISKNGGAFAAVAGAVTEVGSGWYAWAANATDRNALGELAVHIEATGADPVDFKLEIVPWNPFDANLGLNRLDAAMTSRAAASDYTATRAAKLDNLDATISSRLASAAYVPPDNSSITQIESVLDGITNLADWLRTLIRSDAADPVAKVEINLGGGTFDEAKHSLVRAASLAELLDADRYIDTTVTPWALVLTRKTTGGPGVGVELLRQRLQTETGANVTSISTFVGRSVAGGGP